MGENEKDKVTQKFSKKERQRALHIVAEKIEAKMSRIAQKAKCIQGARYAKRWKALRFSQRLEATELPLPFSDMSFWWHIVARVIGAARAFADMCTSLIKSPPPRGEADFSGVRRPRPRVARAEAHQKRVQQKEYNKSKKTIETKRETTKRKSSVDALGCEPEDSQGCEPKDSQLSCFPNPFFSNVEVKGTPPLLP